VIEVIFSGAVPELVSRTLLVALVVLTNWLLNGMLVGLSVAVAIEVEHDGNLNEPMCVFQLKSPLAVKYSLEYQKVQSSTGSTLMLV
jgi:hypothetical protein